MFTFIYADAKFPDNPEEPRFHRGRDDWQHAWLLAEITLGLPEKCGFHVI